MDFSSAAKPFKKAESAACSSLSSSSLQQTASYAGRRSVIGVAELFQNICASICSCSNLGDSAFSCLGWKWVKRDSFGDSLPSLLLWSGPVPCGHHAAVPAAALLKNLCSNSSPEDGFEELCSEDFTTVSHMHSQNIDRSEFQDPCDVTITSKA